MRIIAFVVVLFLLVSVSTSYALQAQKQGGATQKQEPQAKTVVDPVCGMTIDPAKATGKSEYKGTTYFFCSDRCKKTFDANPEAVLKEASQKKN